MKRDHNSAFHISDKVDRVDITVQPLTKSRFRRQENFKQFRIESTYDNTASKLCSACETIDFRGIFSIHASEIPASGLPVFTLINLHPRLSQTPCLSCKMFASMAFSGSECHDGSIIENSRNIWHLRAFRATSPWRIPATKDLLSQGITVLISLVLGNPSIYMSLEKRIDSWKRGMILPTSFMIGNEEFGLGLSCRALEMSPCMEGNRIREMLDSCSTTHSCGKHTLAFPHNANVIDCETRAIIRLTNNMEYLALSYVWGDVRTEKSLHDAALQTGPPNPSHNFPQVVKDAILVARQSGYRYIWVDRYCIKQHDNIEKQHQIRQMANIYSNAVATICALGAHANIGLPGVSTPREPQYRFQSQNYTLVKCPWPEAELQYHLSNSKWTSRGWTFQEPLLSKRCLFFLPETIVHVCHESTTGNTLVMSRSFMARSLILSAKLFESSFGWFQGRVNDGGPFVREVQEYQRRYFTYEGDTLDAFRGILSIIKMQSYWGVPVFIPDFNPGNDDQLIAKGFGFGLLWHVIERKNNSTLRQRAIHDKPLPTWSWASQASVLVKFFGHGYLDSSIRTSKLHFISASTILAANIGAKQLDGSMISVEGLFMKHKKEKCVPEETIFLIISSVTTSWNFTGENQGDDYFTEQEKRVSLPVSLSNTSDKNFDSMSNIDARIYLDSGCSTRPSPDQQNHAAPTTQDGLAILILIDRAYSRGKSGYWLAVRRLDDGTFRREGVIVSKIGIDPSGTPYTDFKIPKESLTTIELG